MGSWFEGDEVGRLVDFFRGGGGDWEREARREGMIGLDLLYLRGMETGRGVGWRICT